MIFSDPPPPNYDFILDPGVDDFKNGIALIKSNAWSLLATVKVLTWRLSASSRFGLHIRPLNATIYWVPCLRCSLANPHCNLTPFTMLASFLPVQCEWLQLCRVAILFLTLVHTVLTGKQISRHLESLYIPKANHPCTVADAVKIVTVGKKWHYFL